MGPKRSNGTKEGACCYFLQIQNIQYTIYLGIFRNYEHYDIYVFITKQLDDYQSFFLIYYLKIWQTVQNSK